MTEPVKNEAELIEWLANNVTWYSHHHYANARSTLAAIRAAGWAVVPVEPTEEMLNGFSEQNGYICSLDWENILAASPIPPVTKP
jgi:hypothetical protein